MSVPETLQSLCLRQVAMELSDLQPHEAEEDVHAVSLFLGLGEQHHMILKSAC